MTFELGNFLNILFFVIKFTATGSSSKASKINKTGLNLNKVLFDFIDSVISTLSKSYPL